MARKQETFGELTEGGAGRAKYMSCCVLGLGRTWKVKLVLDAQVDRK